jgi:hypothetical protein
VITAFANGYTAQCTVNVKASTNVKVGFYALETKSWSTIKSVVNADISSKGGTYTLSLTDSKDMLSNIGSLYLKDLQVQSGISKTSLFANAKIKVESVIFNGVPLTIKQPSPEEAINNNAFDFCILNQWATNTVKVEEAALSDTGSYYITAGTYQDSNTIEVTFTVTDIVVANPTPTPEPTPTPTPTPTTATATPITSIRYDFTITGVQEETSLQFNYTTADWNSAIANLDLQGNGDYSLTITTDNATGMINMGYINRIADSTIIASLKKVTVNGSYELIYTADLTVASDTANGLANIWNVANAGTKIAEGENAYLELNSDKSAFIFYVN